MTGSTLILACLFLTLVTVHTQPASEGVHDPHIRSIEAALLDAVVSGSRVSPTLKHLVDRLEASNVVVYLMFDRSASPNMAGHLSFLTTAGGRRYLRVSIDRRNTGCQLVAILGHELQHAVEIAESPTTTDQARVALLYQRIGFRSAGNSVDRFDSAGAILAGRMIQKEVLARSSELTARRRRETP